MLITLKKLILITVLNALLLSCVSKPKGNVVTIADNVYYTLTTPPVQYVGKTDSHLVEVYFNKQQNRFITQVEYQIDSVSLAAVAVEGIPLFDFFWRADESIKINQYIPLPNIDINYILADIQLCHWPIEVIKASLIGEKISVVQRPTVDNIPGHWIRTITQDNDVIVMIKKIANTVTLNHIRRGYSIKLTELNEDAL